MSPPPQKKKLDGCRLDSFSLVWAPVTSSSEHGFESSGSTKTENFPSGYWILKTDSIAWDLLIYFESHRTVNSNELCFPLLVNLLIFHFGPIHSPQ